jgi:hypothetical protein
LKLVGESFSHCDNARSQSSLSRGGTITAKLRCIRSLLRFEPRENGRTTESQATGKPQNRKRVVTSCLLCADFLPLTSIPSFSGGRLRGLFPAASSSEWTPLGRGSDGRFGLRRFRAKLNPTAFGTHRAFTYALPPSSGLRSVPFTFPPCFFPLPLK